MTRAHFGLVLTLCLILSACGSRDNPVETGEFARGPALFSVGTETAYQVSSAHFGQSRHEIRGGHYEVTLTFGQSVLLTRAGSSDGKYVIESDD